MCFKKALLIKLLLLFHAFSLSALNVTVGTNGSDYNCDGTNDEIEIQAAIDAVYLAGGGTVTLQNGSYHIQSTYLLPKSNVTLIGTNRDLTILTSTRTYSFLMFSNNIPVSNFSMQNMTINAGNAENASGVRLENGSSCHLANIKFTGVSCGGWHLVVGIDGNAAATSNSFSRDILIENCLFDGHRGSMEMCLIFNTKNCRIENCIFQNKMEGCATDGNSPILGLWQKTDSISIRNCTFQDNASREAIYHSNTCKNTLIENCTFLNSGGIRGANMSDYGTFGVPYEERLIVKGCNLTAGVNSITQAGIVLGAIKGVLVIDCNISGYEEGIIFQSGLSVDLPNACTHFAIVRTNIRNGNVYNNLQALHPGVLFQQVGGKMHGFFICGNISSTLTPITQEQPVSFTANVATIYDSLFWLGTTIVAYNGRMDFAFLDSTKQGSPFVVDKCNDIEALRYCSNCPTMSNPDIEMMIRNYDATTADILHSLLYYQPKEIPLSVIPEKQLGQQIKIYPNPVFDIVTIENGCGKDIEIRNTLGQLVLEYKNLPDNTINIQSLPKGVYFVKNSTQIHLFVKL